MGSKPTKEKSKEAVDHFIDDSPSMYGGGIVFIFVFIHDIDVNFVIYRLNRFS